MDKLSDFVGNASVKAALSGMLRTGRIPHAVILEGAGGLGKTTLARILAAAAVCSGEGDIPCGQCGNCRLAAEDIHPDITFVRPAGQTLSVDAVRQVRQDAYTLPHQAPRRVFVFPAADAMTEQAQNALLKILEEPPEYVVFLLLTESAARLLSTIRSRSTVCTLSAPGREEAAARIEALARRQEEGAAWSKEQILAALEAEGDNIGRALQLLQAGERPAEEQAADAILEQAAVGTDLELLKASYALEKDRKTARLILDSLLCKIQVALVHKSGAGGTADYPGARLSRGGLVKMEETVRNALKGLDRNANLSLLSGYLCACFKEAAGL